MKISRSIKHSITSLLFLLWLLLNNTTVFANEVTININDQLFTVKLAITQAERSRGLMHIKSLPENSGMLFIYHEPQIISFWMKQTLIPLDLLFFDSDGRLIELYPNIRPCVSINCKMYTNKTPALFALELAGGTATKFNIQIGNNFIFVGSK